MAMLKQFTAKLQKGTTRGAWTYVVMPGSAEFFHTHGLVRVRGTTGDTVAVAISADLAGE